MTISMFKTAEKKDDRNLDKIYEMLEQLMRGQEQLRDAMDTMSANMKNMTQSGGSPPAAVVFPATPGTSRTSLSRTLTDVTKSISRPELFEAEEKLARQKSRKTEWLKQTFKRGEEWMTKVGPSALKANGCFQHLEAAYKSMQETREYQDHALDSISLVVIILNAMCITCSMDATTAEEELFWGRIDLVFTAIFMIELGVRIRLHGLRYHYCGVEWISNSFDTFLIVADVCQCVLALMEVNSLPSVTILRVVRLTRVARIMRTFQVAMLRDLNAMVAGMKRGATTLCFALCLFIVVIWVMALLCRFMLEDSSEISQAKYFSSVSRSMFTVFRCSFGDCTTEGGASLTESILSSGTTKAVLCAFFYMVYIFFITIGLFNIIAAIFVDTIVTSESNDAQEKMLARLKDNELFATCALFFVQRILDHPESGYVLDGKSLSDVSGELAEIIIDRAVVEDVVRNDPDVLRALDKLDIDRADHQKLADILDHHNTGELSVVDMLNGLQRIRGGHRRSDIISVQLVLEGMQEKIIGLSGATKREEAHLEDLENLLRGNVARPEPPPTCEMV